MRGILTLLVIISITSSTGYSQSTFFYKNQIGYHTYTHTFIELNDSGYICAGRNEDKLFGGNYESFIFRLDKFGNQIWFKMFHDWKGILNIEKLNDTLIIVATSFKLNIGTVNFAIINLNGDSVDSRYIFTNGVYADSRFIKRSKDQGFVLTNASNFDYAFQKVDSNFNNVWHDYMQMGFAGIMYEDIDNGYFACGWSGGTYDAWQVQRRDSMGNILWNRTYGDLWWNTQGDLYPTGVVCPDSNYLIACDRGDYDFMKLDRNTGDTLWTKDIFFGTTYEFILPYDSNVFLIRGHGLSNLHYFINQDADTLFSFHTEVSEIFDIKKTKDNGFAYLGFLFKNSIWYACLVKCDSLGNTIFTSQIELTLQDEDSAFPNPASDYVRFAIPNDLLNRKATITIYDVYGNLFLQKTIAPQEQIDVSLFANGLYTAVISNGDKQRHTRFVVVR
ncbi:MAG: T9SS type A sorting domain-containing protein [Bacteroidetes bacterium]|nr:T9SS type A sorting domain-containing protein [Bacteroidota bacterium]